MAVNERIDISEPLKKLCLLLGLEYQLVASLTFEPSHVEAETFLLDERGAKYVRGTDGEIATALQRFEVRT